MDEVLRTVAKRMWPMRLTILRTPWPVILKPGLVVLLACLALAGGMLIASGSHAAGRQFEVSWRDALLAGSLALAALVLHETGHAAAAHLTGRTVERLEFGMSGVAATSGDTTAWRRAAAIAAGPVIEILAGALLWTAGGADWGSPAGAAGFLALVNGAGNLLPVKPFDGYRLWAFVPLALGGITSLPCLPEGPCPACTGTLPGPPAREAASAA